MKKTFFNIKKLSFILLFTFCLFLTDSFVYADPCKPDASPSEDCGGPPPPPPCYPSCYCPSGVDYGYGLYSVSCTDLNNCGGCGGYGTASCYQPTCGNYSPLAPGYPNPISGNTASNSPCGKSGNIVFGVSPEHSGKLNCEFKSSTLNPGNSGCHYGAYPLCYKLKSCKDIDPNYPHEYMQKDTLDENLKNKYPDGLFFVEDQLGNAGTRGLRCGVYYLVDSPWWQAMRANIYANGKIEAISKPNFSESCQSSNSCSQYIIRTDGSCDSSGNNSAGIALVNSNFGSIKPSQAITNRSVKTTSAYPAFDANISNPKYDYAYFRSLRGNINKCNNNIASAGQICEQDGNMTINTSFTATGVHVVFVEGDLIIKQPIKVPDGRYLAFIVKGEIKIDFTVGSNLTANKCVNKGSGDIQGVYITNKNITVESNPTTYLTDFNRDSRCDKSIVLEGVFASWGNINFMRTFKGCGTNGQGITKGSVYPNYNALNPTETIIYRPDFINSTPDWMKQPKIMRLETI